MDATLVRSSRRPRKVIDVMRVDREESGAEVRDSDDTEAAWVNKGDRPHYGFKAHAAADVIEGLFPGGEVTPANVADTKELKSVVDDLELQADTLVIGDKAYDSQENRDYLNEHHLFDGILRNPGGAGRFARRLSRAIDA